MCSRRSLAPSDAPAPVHARPPQASWLLAVTCAATRACSGACAHAWLVALCAMVLAGAPTTASSQASPGRANGAVSVPAPSTGIVRGAVLDSAGGAPLAGALVQFVPGAGASGEVTSVPADSAGRFAEVRLAPGTWAVGFIHPALDVYGLEPPMVGVRVEAGDTVDLTLALPNARALHAVLCDGAAPGDSSTGAVVGTVRDAEGGSLLPGARVAVAWRELEIADGVRLADRRVVLVTDHGGTFRGCGLPVADGMTVQGESGASGDSSSSSGVVDLQLSSRGIVRRDLVVGRTLVMAAAEAPGDEARDRGATRWGRARLRGTVRDERGRAVARARVLVVGTGRETLSGESGAFAFDSLPPSTRSVEARAVGFIPIRSSVTLMNSAPATVDLAFGTAPPMLDHVMVLGKQSRQSRFLEEFVARARSGQGRYFQAADIERTQPVTLTDILRMTPGVRVAPSRNGLAQSIRGRGNCTPAVVVDRMPLAGGADELDFFVRPQDVLAMEIYMGPSGMSAEFGFLNNSCGLVAVWTKR